MIAVVVSAMVVQASLAKSAEKRVHDLAHDLGKNMLVVPEQTNLAAFHALEYGDATVPDTYAQQVRNSSLGQHIGAVQNRLYGNVEVDGIAAIVVGEADLLPPGNFPGSKDSAPAVIGSALAKQLGLSEDDELTVRGHTLIVKRVVAELPPGLDMAVITELSTAQMILGKPGGVNAMFMAGCWCSIDVPALARKVETELPGTRAITVAGVLQSQTGTIDTVERYSDVLFGVALALIAGITFVLFKFQVRRQVREIGLLLAIGASPSMIVALFVGAAAVVGASGGIAGLLLGGPMTGYVSEAFLGSALPASTGALAPVLLVTVLVSTLAAFLPARRAAGMDPTTVLLEI
jgi:putative ABC transport system permease protein